MEDPRITERLDKVAVPIRPAARPGASHVGVGGTSQHITGSGDRWRSAGLGSARRGAEQPLEPSGSSAPIFARLPPGRAGGARPMAVPSPVRRESR